MNAHEILKRDQFIEQIF